VDAAALVLCALLIRFSLLLVHLTSANKPYANLARKGSTIAHDFEQVQSPNTFSRMERGALPEDRLVVLNQWISRTHLVRGAFDGVSAAPGPNTGDSPVRADSSISLSGTPTCVARDPCRMTEVDEGQVAIHRSSDAKLRLRCGQTLASLDYAHAVPDQVAHASIHFDANRDRGLEAQHVADGHHDHHWAGSLNPVSGIGSESAKGTRFTDGPEHHPAATCRGAIASERCSAEADASAQPHSVHSEIPCTPSGLGGQDAQRAGPHGGTWFSPGPCAGDGDAQGCSADRTAAARLPHSQTPDPGVPEHAVHTTRPSSLPGGAVTGAGAAAPPSLQYPQHRCSALELFQALCVGLVGLCLRGRLHGVLRSQPSTLPHYNESTASAAAEQDWRQGATRRANPAKVGCPRCWLCASSFANHDVCCAGPSYAG
jgi:hypothetical protein